MAVAPRSVPGLMRRGRRCRSRRATAWGDTRLTVPPGTAGPLRDLLTGAVVAPIDGVIPVGEALAHLPVALLLAESGA